MAKKGQGCGTCGCCGAAFAATPLVGIQCGSMTKRNKSLFISLIEHYQRKIDPAVKRKLHNKRICIYQPTCSEYTKQSIKKHGAFIGTIKGIVRLIRCNPFSSGGYDPVR